MADPIVPDPQTTTAPEIPVQEMQVIPITVATETPLETETEPPAPETTAAPAAEDRKVEKLPDWAQKAIKDNAFEAREARRRAAALAAENETLKRGAAPAPTPADTAAARDAAPAGGFKSQAEFDAAVAREANNREMASRTQNAAKEFGTKLDTIWNAGVEAFKDEFSTVADNLNAVGLLPVPDENGNYGNDAFMRLVMATDNPAAVLHAYGSDPAKAAGLMALTPERRAIEIAKMDVAVGTKRVAPISKVPKPVETVEGSPRFSEEPSDTMTDAQWYAARDKQLANRP
jgi:hypothetical protein